MITTELDHIIVKVLKQFFQTSKIRCTWFYYIEEISKYWIDLELPFDEELHEVGQLLKCAWAIPLALEHGKSIGMTFEKVMTAIERYVNIEEYPNTVVFKEKLKLSWASRISFICPFSTSDYEATAEIHDLEDHPDCEQNNNTTIRFRRDHYEGPVGGPEKRRRRNKNLDDVIYSVVAASPYFEMSERTC
ncbi:hypothetical protein HCN44_007213 [Aphidius gifuensis]|uniref:Uncharacterized protein n=1 Tax=Aphidius gifuensis TaxID=684658 RepID=A0A834XKI8_APHGI|nr:hypothetical protein HCN44_007213 [Aphidius gifuensis]